MMKKTCKKPLFQGCATAIITPYDNTNHVDLSVFKTLVSRQLDQGVSAILVAGSTGEELLLTEEEKISLIKTAVKVVDCKIPIIVGTGAITAQKTIHNCQVAKEHGASGVLIAPPSYLKPTQAGLVDFYTEIASQVDLPIILYNIPGRSAINITANTCKKLSEIENIIGIKEASGDLKQIKEIITLCEEDLPVYAGNDDQYFDVLHLGGYGIISVLSNLEPKYVSNMYPLFKNGDTEECSALQDNMKYMIQSLFIQSNPIPIKFLMQKNGYACGIPRKPLTPLAVKYEKKVIFTYTNFIQSTLYQSYGN